MAAFQGFDLPEVSADKLASMSREDLLKHLKQLEEYMYTLTEQLRYTLNNLDADNMSDDFVAEVSNSSAVRALTQTVENVQNGMKSVQKQTAEGFENVVYKDEVVSSINQTAEMIKIDADKIALEGYVSINGKFTVDENGNMTATGGEIGGFEIENNTITSSGIVLDSSQSSGGLYITQNYEVCGTLSGSVSGVNEHAVALTAIGNYAHASVFGGTGSRLNVGYNSSTRKEEARLVAGSTSLVVTNGRIDIGSTGTDVYIAGQLFGGGGSGSVSCGQASCSGTWRDMPVGSATAVAAFCADDNGYIIKTRKSGNWNWQWCIDGSSSLSCTACWIAVD